MNEQPVIHILGAGLAGSEAALQLANRGYQVTLFDMKPVKRSPAHHTNDFAEIVCSNSLGSLMPTSASGLLKQELRQLDCQLLNIAESVSVPAGKALAVDRDGFSRLVTERVNQHPNITCVGEEVTQVPDEADYVIIATGPMTSEGLAADLSRRLNRKQLYFFDAASPIVTRDSVNMDIAFYQDRYNKTAQTEPEAAQSYINCPLNKDQYNALVDKILSSEKTPLKEFEASDTRFFESCLPIEVLASRGHDTLRFGPMKPVGITDPKTGRWPYAVVQLRQDNAEGTLYNLVGFQTNIKWGEQREMIQMIPGLENAEIVRLGVMHRNTYIHSPEVLEPTLQLKCAPNILMAGQLTGTEGYTESIATGLFAAINVAHLIEGETPAHLPKDTMLGALLHYITRPEAIGQSFQPINSNWGIMPLLDPPIRGKAERAQAYVERAEASLNQWLSEQRRPVTA